MHDLDLHGLTHFNPVSVREERQRHRLVGQYAVFAENREVAFRVRNRFRVNWGDGVIQSFDSGALARHTYDFDALENTENGTHAYRVAVITIEAQKAYHLTELDLDPLEEEGAVLPTLNWITIRLCAPNLNALILNRSNSKKKFPLLQQLNIVNQ